MSAGKDTTEWKLTAGVVVTMVLTILATVIDQLMGSGLIKDGTWLGVLGAVGSVLSALGYSASRAHVKASMAKASAIKTAAVMGNSQGRQASGVEDGPPSPVT